MQHVHEPWFCSGCPECEGWRRVPPIRVGALPIPPVYRCAGAGAFAGCARKVARMGERCARCQSVERQVATWAEAQAWIAAQQAPPPAAVQWAATGRAA